MEETRAASKEEHLALGSCSKCGLIRRLYGSGLCGDCNDFELWKNGGEDRTVTE